MSGSDTHFMRIFFSLLPKRKIKKKNKNVERSGDVCAFSVRILCTADKRVMMARKIKLGKNGDELAHLR